MLVHSVSGKQRREGPWGSLTSQLSLTTETQVLVRDCLRKQCERHRETLLIWADEQGGFGFHSAERCSGGEAGIRRQETEVFRASLGLVPLSQPLLMLFCSLVAMTVAEDMPHPDSHRSLLDRHAAFPPYGESGVAQPQEGNGSSWSCVPVPVPVPGMRGGKLRMATLGLCD